MVRRMLATALLAGLTTVPALADEIQVPPLQPHRAVYDLSLKNASERSGIDAIYGRMVFEFTGAACKGYTTRFRFVTRIDTGEDQRVSDQRLNSFEDKDGVTFRFDNEAYTDEQLDKKIKGVATRKPDGLSVLLEGGEDAPARTLDLPASIYPSAHMREVISKALNGTPLFDAKVFDGSEDGDKSLLVTTIIGKPETSESADGTDPKAAGVLTGKTWWPVTASYFNEGPDGDTEPSYRLSFKLYDSGISRDLVMDYGEFALSGKLASLELLPEESCETPEAP